MPFVAPALLAALHRRGVSPQILLQQLLEGTPLTGCGRPRAWPSLAQLRVRDLLGMVIRPPSSWAARAAPCGVLAAAVLADATIATWADGDGSPAALLGPEQCEALLSLTETFWGDVADSFVAQVLTPTAPPSGLHTAARLLGLTLGASCVSASSSSATSLQIWQLAKEPRWVAALSEVGLGTVALLELTRRSCGPQGEALALTSVEVHPARRRQGLGRHLVREVVRWLACAGYPAQSLQTELLPLHYPQTLSTQLAPEYLLQALDAREALGRFCEQIQVDFVAAASL